MANSVYTVRQFSRTTWIMGTGGLALVLVLGVVFYTSHTKELQKPGTLSLTEGQTLAQAIQREFSDQDRDSDGLRDWEEGLWGADPNNPDTDNDGALDGEEVDNNRNPIKAGPDDVLTDIQIQNGVRSYEELNNTDVFARAFFTDYLQLRQGGQLQTQTGKDKLVEQLLSNESLSSFTENNFTEADVTKSQLNTPSAFRQYANAVGSIVETFSLNNRNEAVILLEALEKDDPSVLDELIPIQEAYKNIGEEMQKLVVPKDAVDIHLELLSSISRIETTIAIMRKTFTDPLQAISALKAYQGNATALRLAFVNANTFFNKQGIVFDQTESGYLFTSIAKNN